jgi:hypothetical protein
VLFHQVRNDIDAVRLHLAAVLVVRFERDSEFSKPRFEIVTQPTMEFAGGYQRGAVNLKLRLQLPVAF